MRFLAIKPKTKYKASLENPKTEINCKKVLPLSIAIQKLLHYLLQKEPD